MVCVFDIVILQMVGTLSAQLEGRLRFDYANPHAGFDRSRVKGMVAHLIHMRDPKNCTALEVTAGGKLYQAREERDV